MARTKVAPTLTANVLRHPPLDWRGSEELAEMQAQLRALLAVARALRDLSGLLDAVDERDGYPPSQLPSRRSARLALGRLARASGGKGRA